MADNALVADVEFVAARDGGGVEAVSAQELAGERARLRGEALNDDAVNTSRNAAIAERLWSPQNVTDVNSMYTRMHAVGLELPVDGRGCPASDAASPEIPSIMQPSPHKA